jgi:hypothetical protein
MAIIKPKAAAEIKIPDSTLAKQATELLLNQGREFLYYH